MKKALKEIVGGFNSLVIGLRITLAQFFKPTVTVQYPHQTLQVPPRFRGHIELVQDPTTGKAICFACKLCERACPSDCITVEGAKLEGAKKRSVTAYKLDFTKCSLCGECVEACRDGAIRFSREYNLAGLSKDEFVMDLIKRLENEARATGGTGALAAGPAAPGQEAHAAPGQDAQVTPRPGVQAALGPDAQTAGGKSGGGQT
jgi:NADH-quinone oxidoreductase subunit I